MLGDWLDPRDLVGAAAEQHHLAEAGLGLQLAVRDPELVFLLAHSLTIERMFPLRQARPREAGQGAPDLARIRGPRAEGKKPLNGRRCVVIVPERDIGNLGLVEVRRLLDSLAEFRTSGAWNDADAAVWARLVRREADLLANQRLDREGKKA